MHMVIEDTPLARSSEVVTRPDERLHEPKRRWGGGTQTDGHLTGQKRTDTNEVVQEETSPSSPHVRRLKQWNNQGRDTLSSFNASGYWVL